MYFQFALRGSQNSYDACLYFHKQVCACIYKVTAGLLHTAFQATEVMPTISSSLMNPHAPSFKAQQAQDAIQQDVSRCAKHVLLRSEGFSKKDATKRGKEVGCVAFSHLLMRYSTSGKLEPGVGSKRVKEDTRGGSVESWGRVSTQYCLSGKALNAAHA